MSCQRTAVGQAYHPVNGRLGIVEIASTGRYVTPERQVGVYYVSIEERQPNPNESNVLCRSPVSNYEL